MVELTRKKMHVSLPSTSSGFLCSVWGRGVSRDVVLHIRSLHLVPTNWHGGGADPFSAWAARECSAGPNASAQSKYDVSGANGAATHGIPAEASLSTAALTMALALSCSNHQPQSGRRRRCHGLRAPGFCAAGLLRMETQEPGGRPAVPKLPLLAIRYGARRITGARGY
jgi:hypothetical protein